MLAAREFWLSAVACSTGVQATVRAAWRARGVRGPAARVEPAGGGARGRAATDGARHGPGSRVVHRPGWQSPRTDQDLGSATASADTRRPQTPGVRGRTAEGR